MSDSGLKVLLIGPHPPPHGGISIHVWSACTLLRQHGVRCRVVNVDPRAPSSDAYIRIAGASGLLRELLRHSWNDWAIHVHINGHNSKSWLIALAGSIAAQNGCGGLLTIHSGMAPQYLRECRRTDRGMARLACLQFDRIVCVNAEIAETVRRLGVSTSRIEVLPAFLPIPVPHVSIPMELQIWLDRHDPVLSTAMFFRPEYGFDLLVEALVRLRPRHPDIGCIVMGTGEDRVAAEMQVQSRGLEESVRILGDTGHDMCLALMSRSAVFIRPTLRDGDSVSVREAVSMGVPVVASDVGTRPEEALLFEAGNLNGLVDHLERVLAACPQRTKIVPPADSAQRLLNLYTGAGLIQS
jgi:glycogen synthase